MNLIELIRNLVVGLLALGACVTGTLSFASQHAASQANQKPRFPCPIVDEQAVDLDLYIARQAGPEFTTKPVSGPLSKIILIGEPEHRSSVAFKAQKKILDEAGKQKLYFAGIEGEPFEPNGVDRYAPIRLYNPEIVEKVDIFGVEEPYLYGLSAAVELSARFTSAAILGSLPGFIWIPNKDWLDVKKDFVWMLARNSDARDVLTELAGSTANVEKLAGDTLRVINGYLDDGGSAPVDRTQNLLKEAMKIGDFGLAGLATRLADSYLEKAELRYQDSIWEDTLGAAAGVLTYPGDPEIHENFINEVAARWRNQEMASNIARIYCLAKAATKDLKILVGRKHIAGIKSILMKIRPTPKLEILVQPIDEFIESDTHGMPLQ